MFRLFAISVLTALVASRRLDSTVKESTITISKTKYGASCEDLHTLFHSRVVELQTLLDAHSDVSDFSRATQARFIVRSFGVVRTLRRARTCSWVVEGDSADIEQTQAIVQSLLADNPCAEAAAAELQTGSSAQTAEIEMEFVRRAMSILMSDTCEATESDEESTTLITDDDMSLEANLVEAEAQARENIDEMVSVLDVEETVGSFAQTDSKMQWSFRGIMRGLGVIFLALLLLIACTGAAAFIGILLGFAFAAATVSCTSRGCLYFGFPQAGWGALVGTTVGLASCSYQLYTQLLVPALATPGSQ